MTTDTPQWHPQDERPAWVAYAIRNSNTVLPISGTPMFDKLNAWLLGEINKRGPQELRYLQDVYLMFDDGFDGEDMDAFRQMDINGFELHASLCAYTMCARANSLPI